MIYKKDIINSAFIVSFPVYGIGSYVSAAISPSLGYIVSMVPFLFILIFYILDLLYLREFNVKVNGWYLLMGVFLISAVTSLFISLNKNLPETNQTLTTVRSFLLVIPFQAFVAIQLYNEKEDKLIKLTFISLSLLLLINYIGNFVLGLHNELHSIEGRLSFPFLDGFYSGSCLLAILSLMLLYFFKNIRNDPFLLVGWIAYFAVNLVSLFYINSRLTTLIFLLISVLMILNAIGKSTTVFWVSIFTVPILLSSGLLLYQILSLPVFSSILQRVDVVDVMTFNGRAFLWQDALDWLMYDQRGLMLGNGYRGHYFLDLVSDVAELWNLKEIHHLHLHSSSLEILVSQGVVGYAIFLLLFFHLFIHFRNGYLKRAKEGALFPVAVFLLIIMQVDTFVYMENLGALVFAWLLSFAVMRKIPEANTGQGMKHHIEMQNAR